jgi:hypothetical protein
MHHHIIYGYTGVERIAFIIKKGRYGVMIPNITADHYINIQCGNTRPQQFSHFTECFAYQQGALPHHFHFLICLNEHHKAANITIKKTRQTAGPVSGLLILLHLNS